MKDYTLFPKVLLRVPLLPLSTTQHAFKDDQHFKKAFKNRLVLESLFLSSPNLYNKAIKWIEGAKIENNELKRLKLSLAKYLIRMSTRPTPFGLTAGIALLDWQKESSFKIKHPHDHKRYTRLDMFLLVQVVRALTTHEEIRPHLSLSPNNTLYKHGGSIRFMERKTAGYRISYEISEVAANEYLDRILNLAVGGRTMLDLADQITDEDISFEEALDFVDYVFDQQLLVSELEPNLTGDDLLIHLIRALERVVGKTQSAYATTALAVLRSVKARLERLDDERHENEIAHYKAILKELQTLNIDVTERHLVRVDLIKNTSNPGISHRLAGDIRKGLAVLNMICQKRNTMVGLTDFASRFVDRYGQKEIPILQALDNESGVGYLQKGDGAYPAPMVDDIPVGQQEKVTHSLDKNARTQFLSDKLIDAIKRDEYEIRLDKEDFSHLEDTWHDIPETITAIGNFLSQGKIHIKAMAGHASGAAMYGRFTDSDEEVREYVNSITDLEQFHMPDKLITEVVHLPQSRQGNVMSRSRLRKYEIPFLARSTVEQSDQIHLSDLTVSVDARGNIVLRSVSRQKEVIPRICNAHDHAKNALPLYHFLGDLQTQHYARGLFFDWERLDSSPFSPRLSYKNVILIRAMWTFQAGDLKELLVGGELDHNRLDVWRRKWKVPAKVVIIEQDRELLIDFELLFHKQIFESYISGANDIRMAEYLFDTEGAIVTDVEGSAYANEFLVSFGKNKSGETEPEPARPSKPLVNVKEGLKSDFLLGSEWVYYKVYMGFGTANAFLEEQLKPLVVELRSHGIIKGWFFIRYQDPHSHLRIRFRLKSLDKIGDLVLRIHRLLEPLYEQGVVLDVRNDVYQREIERYGKSTIDSCEEIFEAQSVAIVDFIEKVVEASEPDLMFLLFAIAGANAVLDDFGYSSKSKSEFSQRAFAGFASEFDANKYTKKKFGEKYSLYRDLIAFVLDGKDVSNKSFKREWDQFNELISRMRVAQAVPVQQILSVNSSGQLEVEHYPFVWSLIHMFVNRLFSSKQRKYEFLMYALLSSYYSAQLKKG